MDQIINLHSWLRANHELFNLDYETGKQFGPKLYDTACASNIDLHLTPLGQARQFVETGGT